MYSKECLTLLQVPRYGDLAAVYTEMKPEKSLLTLNRGLGLVYGGICKMAHHQHRYDTINVASSRAWRG